MMIRKLFLGAFITASFGLAVEKLDPWLKIEIGRSLKLREVQSTETVSSKVGVFIKLTSEKIDGKAFTEEYGGEFLSQVGDILTARFDTKALSLLAQDSRVKFIEKPKRLKYQLDSASLASGVSNIRAGELSRYQGQGVIIGIMDSGVDYTHPSIADRILYIYDTTTGEVCDRAKIRAGSCRQRDNVGHGTHVAGIAAGNGRRHDGTQSPYIGVAPAAEIVSVKVGDYDVSSEGVIAGINFVRDVAKRLGRPFVINLSLGSDLGPHDGTDLFSQALSKFSQEGVIIVKASGNSASDGIHVGGKLTAGGTVNHSFVILSRVAAIDVWYPGSDSFSVQVSSPCGSTPFIPVSSTVTYQLGTCGTVNVSSSDVNPLNGDKEIVIEIESPAVSSYIWTLTLRGDSVLDGTYHAWGSGVGFADASRQYTLSSDSAVEGIIVVGSFTSKVAPSVNADSTLNDLSVFSGRGPTRGCSAGCPVLIKPDITAPGEVVCSAFPTYIQDGAYNVCGEVSYKALQGTSMAAPVVSGTIALMLSKNSNLSPPVVKDILIKTAYRDIFTQNAPNNDWGYGKLSASGALAATPSSSGGCYASPIGGKVLGDLILILLVFLGVVLRGRLSTR
jgi:subtilisin family serine protease